MTSPFDPNPPGGVDAGAPSTAAPARRAWDAANNELLRQLARLAPARLRQPGTTLGLELEYAVSVADEHASFARLLPRLVALSGTHFVDDRSGRFWWRNGLRLMADGHYAEIAVPPLPMSPRLPGDVVASVAWAESQLQKLLERYASSVGRSCALEPYSCHFNVGTAHFVDGRKLARRVAEAFGPLIALITSRPPVLGIIVRPRPGRLEIVTDPVADDAQLRAACILILGAVGVALRAEAGRPGRDLPTLPANALAQARIRPGLRLTLPALDASAIASLATLTLPLAGGGQLILADWAARCWDSLRDWSKENFGELATARIDAFVDFSRPTAFAGAVPINAAPTTVEASPLAAALGSRQIGRWCLVPRFVDWSFVVVEATAPRRCALLTLPATYCEAYGDGRMDEAMGAALERLPASKIGGPVINDIAQAASVGLYAGIAPAELARLLERPLPHDAAQRAGKWKKKPSHALCTVVEAADGIRIYIPRTLDPLRLLQEQEPPRNDVVVANGVWGHSGAFGHSHVDHSVRGLGFDFAFARSYRSSVDYDGTLGRNWDHAFDIRVVPVRPGGAEAVPGGWCEIFRPAATSAGLSYYDGTGRKTDHAFVSWERRSVQWCDARFEAIVTTYSQNDGDSFAIERYAVIAGAPPTPLTEPIFYRVRLRGGVRYLLNCHGYVVQVRDRNHNQMTLSYGEGNPKTLYRVLSDVVDTVNNRYRFGYTRAPNGMPRLTSLTELNGKLRTLTFGYDPAMEVLETVRLATGNAGTPEIRYAYVPGGRVGLLKRITDPSAPNASDDCAWLENTFTGPPEQERVVRQRVGTGASCGPACGGEFEIGYPAPTRVTVRDRTGVVTRHRIDNGTLRETELDDDAVVGGQVVPGTTIRHRYDYDRHFHLVLHEWPSGRKDRFEYRNINRPVTAGDERDKTGTGEFTHALDLARDDLRRRWIETSAGSIAFEAAYRHERLFNAPESVAGPSGRITFYYDHGRCGVAQRNGNPVRVDAPGQLLPSGQRRAVVERREYGLGGRLTMRVDPDGVREDYEIHPSGQVERHLVGGKLVASYRFDEVGNPLERRDERNSKTSFAYDGRDNLVLVTDAMNHQVSFGYDKSDRMVARQRIVIDDPTTIAGVSAAPPRLIVERFEVDALGSTRSATEVVTNLTTGATAVRVRRWDFDGEGRLTATRSPRATSGARPDAVSVAAYNARGLTRERGGAGGRVTKSYYDVDGHLALVIDASGRKTSIGYDEFGRVTSRTLPDGTVEHFEYDGHELWREWVEGPVAVTPANPSQRGVLRETRMRRDALGRAIVTDDVVFDPAATASVASVSASTSFANLFASAPAPAGGVARASTWFTPGGRVSRVDAPGDATTAFVHRFADQGQLESVALPGGHKVEFVYDGSFVHRKTTLLVPSAAQVVSPEQPPLSVSEEETRDALGRVISRKDANATVTEFSYDSLGRVRAEKTASGLRTRAYDAFGHEERIEIHGVGPAGGPARSIVQTRVHDVNGNPERAVDALGRETLITYDGNDEPETFEMPFRGRVVVLRNPDGSVQRTTMGAGRSVAVNYDAGGRLSDITATEGAGSYVRRFLSDGLGRVTSAIDDNGGGPGASVAIERAYDSLGRMARERVEATGLGFDQTVTQEYEIDSRRRRVIYPQSNPELDYVLSRDGYLTSITRNGELLLSRVHQGPGRVLEQTQPITIDVRLPVPATSRLDITEARRHDDFGRLDWRSLWLDDALIASGGPLHIASSEWLAYGADGGLERRGVGALRGVAGATLYSRTEFKHDGAGRMTSSALVEGADMRTTEFVWDDANVMRGMTETTVQAGATTTKSTTVGYPLDPNTSDRLISAPDGEDAFRFDADGRLARALHRPAPGAAADLVRDFEFDAFDRLERCTVNRGGTTRSFDYLYDAFGRLVARTESGVAGAAARTLFVHHGERPIAEYDGQSRRRKTYVYDLNGQLVSYRSIEATELVDALPIAGIDGAPWFTLRRRLGLLQLPPTAGTTTADRLRYYLEQVPLVLEEHRSHLFVDAPIRRFDVVNGQLQVTPVTEAIVPVIAGGRRLFAEEGIALVGGRWLDTALREFISPDPGGPWGDALSLGNDRSYAGNSPVMRGDDGRAAIVPLIVGGLILGGLIGIGYAVGRQSVQILEGSRDGFDLGEIGWSAAMGAGCGVLFVLVPVKVAIVGGIVLAGLGAYSTVQQLRSGEIGGWTALYDAAAMALPFGLARARAPLKSWWLNRLSRNAFERMAAVRALPASDQLPRLPRYLFEEEALFVVDTAARTAHPNEVAAVQPRQWWRIGYRTIEGGPESVSVPSGWRAIAHNHPGSELIHRLPAPTDFEHSRLGRIGSWIRARRFGVSDEPAHSQYRIVGEGDAARVRIRPDFPEDFAGLVHKWEQHGFARWVGGEIEFAPARFIYDVYGANGEFSWSLSGGRRYYRTSQASGDRAALAGYQHAYLIDRHGYLPSPD